MSDIAARAGGSKATLYGHFKSKQELFAASVLDGMVREPGGGTLAAGEPAVWLSRFGEQLLGRICSETWMEQLRLLAAEARQAPELASAFYRTTLGSELAALATALERAAEKGDLRIEDAGQAAERFVGLCLADFHVRLLLGHAQKPMPDQLRSHIAGAVEFFMRAHGPQAHAT